MEAAASAPPEVAGLVAEADEALRAGDLAAAERLLALVVGTVPGWQPGHIRLGMLLLARSRLGEAVAALQRAVRASPASAEGHFLLALALSGVGRMEIAADPFRRAVAVAPGDVRAYAGLWTIQARRHRAPRPARLRAWILALDPGFDEERARRGSGLSG